MAEKKVQHFKLWAYALQKRHLAGELLKPIQIRFYQEALGIKPGSPAIGAMA